MKLILHKAKLNEMSYVATNLLIKAQFFQGCLEGGKSIMESLTRNF